MPVRMSSIPNPRYAASDLPGSRLHGNDGRGLLRRQALDRSAAVGEGHANERIGGWSPGRRCAGSSAQRFSPHAPGLDGGGARQPRGDRGQGLHRAGENRIERQAHLAQHRRLPQHAELAGSILAHFQVGGPDHWARPGSGAKTSISEPVPGGVWPASGASSRPDLRMADEFSSHAARRHRRLSGIASSRRRVSPGRSPAAPGTIPPSGAGALRQRAGPAAAISACPRPGAARSRT